MERNCESVWRWGSKLAPHRREKENFGCNDYRIRKTEKLLLTLRRILHSLFQPLSTAQWITGGI